MTGQCSSGTGLFLSKNGLWSVHCPRCKRVREFRRRDAALSADKRKTVCVKCAAKERCTYMHVKNGFLTADINKFSKSAQRRGLQWGIDFNTLVELWNAQGGKCALSGITLRKRPRTWSLDRIDNAGGYVRDNVQLVHIDLNQMKNHHSQDYFRHLCKLVHENSPSED